MLNLKKLVLEAQRKQEAKYKAYFEKGVFVLKNDTFRVFRFFLPEGSIC